MKKILIVGGGTQGLELSFLAGKLNLHRILIDRKPQAPASAMVEEFHCFDVLSDKSKLENLAGACDWIIPALEDLEVLEYLDSLKDRCRVLFDLESYRISESKKTSNDFMERIGVKTSFGNSARCDKYIAKPHTGSGSTGVVIIDKDALDEFNRQGSYCIEPFLDGPSYSVEVIGNGTEFESYQITEIIVDDSYDCKRVVCPVSINAPVEKKIRNMAVQIAEGLSLKSIMDLEVIVSQDEVYALEIDARFPSQTPIAIYASTGVNLLERLIHFGSPRPTRKERHVSYEQVQVKDGAFEVIGERIVHHAGPLRLESNFLGAQEAMTNYTEKQSEWMGIFIHSAESESLLAEQKERTYRALSTLAWTSNQGVLI